MNPLIARAAEACRAVEAKAKATKRGCPAGTGSVTFHAGAEAAAADCANAVEALDGAEGVRRGHRPEGNRAVVEVVPTSDLLPDDTIWNDDGWFCVLDNDQNDSTQVVAAPIIDDSAGQDEPGTAYGEFFLRALSLSPSPPDALALLREARNALTIGIDVPENDGTVTQIAPKYRADLLRRIDALLAGRAS